MKKQIISVKAEPLRFPLITCSNRAKAYTEIKLFCTVTCLKAEPLPFQAYCANKGKMLSWVAILLYRYLPKGRPLYVGQLYF